jgi:hypothetical protein
MFCQAIRLLLCHKRSIFLSTLLLEEEIWLFWGLHKVYLYPLRHSVQDPQTVFTFSHIFSNSNTFIHKRVGYDFNGNRKRNGNIPFISFYKKFGTRRSSSSNPASRPPVHGKVGRFHSSWT